MRSATVNKSAKIKCRFKIYTTLVVELFVMFEMLRIAFTIKLFFVMLETQDLIYATTDHASRTS